MEISLTAGNDQIIEAFSRLETARDVASLLEIRYDRLVYILYTLDLHSQYRIFSISKKSGGTRIISAPISTLKILQRKLNYVFSLVYVPKHSTHGFTQGRSIVTNARAHVRKLIVLNVDLKNFFPSITFGRVRGLLMAAPYNIPAAASTVLAQLCCVDSVLPQGAPTSPVISNMVCAKLDSQLIRFAKKYRCTYTRYADDITISSTRRNLPNEILRVKSNDGTVAIELGPEFRKIIENNWFEVNEEKVRLNSRRNRQEVTGLIVNDKPNVKRRFIMQLRAMLHAWERFGYDNAEREHLLRYYSKNVSPDKEAPKYSDIIEGKLAFLGMVRGQRDRLYRRYANKYFELSEKPAFKYTDDPLEKINASLWVVSDEKHGATGTAFNLEGIGIVTCAHTLNEKSILVNPVDLTEHKFKVIKYSPSEKLDLAILNVTNSKREFLERSNVAVNKRTKIAAIGYPRYLPGNDSNIVEGAVSEIRILSACEMILHSAITYGGMSGGPLINSDDKVVGVNAAGIQEIKDITRGLFNGAIAISEIDKLLS